MSEDDKNPAGEQTNISAADAEILNQELRRASSTAGKANEGEASDAKPTPGLPHIIDSDHA